MLNADRTASPKKGVRWTICALIFFAMTVNYLDRQLFSILVPFFEDDLKLGPTDLALINVCFILPYGFAMIFIGSFIDRIGTRKGLAITYGLWNVAMIGHALVRGLGGFMGARFLLGLGESGMYPSAIKTMTEWFPIRERALANGYVNAGANMGAFFAPIVGVYIANQYSWRACFVFTGIVGMVWLAFWIPKYRSPGEHPKVQQEELDYIHRDNETPTPKLSYAQLFAMRPIYGLSVAKALSDAPWWFYLTWMPKFLVDQFHLSTTFMAVAIPVIYVVADLGSIAGGWLSSNLIRRGYPVGTARKLTMLACAIAVIPVMSVGFLVDHADIAGIPTVYWTIGIVAIAAGAHQGFSSNLFTIISDTAPKSSIAMAVGAINGFAMIGASAMQFFVGRAVQVTSSYTLPFIAAGGLYLIALAALHLIVPKVEPAPTNKRANLFLVACGGAAVLAILGVLQYVMNKPPYASIDDYLAKRGQELHAGPPVVGPDATVGWMPAHWYVWNAGSAKPKYDLVKLDLHGSPFIESKGDKASRYKGPKQVDLPR